MDDRWSAPIWHQQSAGQTGFVAEQNSGRPSGPVLGGPWHGLIQAGRLECEIETLLRNLTWACRLAFLARQKVVLIAFRAAIGELTALSAHTVCSS